MMARRVTHEEGLLIGGSCGTAVAAALQVAEKLTADDLVVVLTPDSGRLYLSKVFNDDWMAEFGFLTSDGPTVNDVLAAKSGEVPPLIYVRPHQTVREAIQLMREHGVSQMPVAKKRHAARRGRGHGFGRRSCSSWSALLRTPPCWMPRSRTS